jgi:hypothetical protein
VAWRRQKQKRMVNRKGKGRGTVVCMRGLCGGGKGGSAFGGVGVAWVRLIVDVDGGEWR